MRPAFYNAGSGGRRPPIPTRQQQITEKISFQGLTVNSPTYGQVLWWETTTWWPNPIDRQAAYKAKHAAGDTHIIMDLGGSYKELGDQYDQVGADYTQNLPAFVKLVEEALDNGFLIDMRLLGDGQGAGPGYNDPIGSTYGFDWLYNNFPRIAAAFKPLYKYITFVPGYDGVFYGWSPEQILAFGGLFRSIFPDGYLGIEFNTGHIPVGGGADDYTATGRMRDYDVIYGEYDPFNYHSDSTWQVNGRMVRPYNRPSDQPAGDDLNPPFYLAQQSARGPWSFIPFEILTYRWVRGQVSLQELRDSKQYFLQMGAVNPSYPQNL